MALILGIETSTDTCSVALGANGNVLNELNIFEGNQHASQLHLMVKKILMDAGKNLEEIDAVAVSIGPGSYTGLRVGVSATKGLAFALNIPCIGVNSLQAMAQKYILENPDFEGLLVPMIDARRMEVYTATFTHDLKLLNETRAEIIDEHSFAEIRLNKNVLYFGNGALKCKEVLNQQNFEFKSFTCGASGLIAPAESSFQMRNFLDTAYFEPYYLKDFVGTTPSKK